ncbi:MAG: phosphate regulon transcriptional regulator PhoB [Proteobacteria bacterium]|nr:phosphate regulon transcriptional regulator PhoB [Pseudomonadota bacterium]MDA1059185.1 phosphate regulon transcriptional regulator PhoB [Pseudomonadota bacterium]
MKPHVLVVEDEPSLVEVLRYNLEKAGYRVSVAGDGAEALGGVRDAIPDLIILDWMLPKLSGIEVCRQLREDPESKNVPVIMLTARGEEADRLKGLASGADDYVVKPFSPAELLARVRAVLRRSTSSAPDETLVYRDLTMDLAAHKVSRNGRAVHLGPTEFRLLRVLLKRPGRVFSREQLLDLAWGRDIYLEARTIDVHVRRLRKQLNGPAESDLIRTVRGAGYSLDAGD